MKERNETLKKFKKDLPELNNLSDDEISSLLENYLENDFFYPNVKAQKRIKKFCEWYLEDDDSLLPILKKQRLNKRIRIEFIRILGGVEIFEFKDQNLINSKKIIEKICNASMKTGENNKK